MFVESMIIAYLTLAVLAFVILLHQVGRTALLAILFFLGVWIIYSLGLIGRGFGRPEITSILFFGVAAMSLVWIVARPCVEDIYNSLRQINHLSIPAYAIVLWLPWLAIAGAIYGLSDVRDQFITSKVYDFDARTFWACNKSGNLICTTNKPDLEADINLTIETVSQNINARVSGWTETAISQVGSSTTNATQTLMRKVFDDPNVPLFPRQLFDLPQKCRPWHWFSRPSECIKRKILKTVQAAYANMRHDLRSELKEALDKSADTGEDMAAVTRLFVKTRATTTINVAKTNALWANWSLFSWLKIAAIFSTAFLVLVVVRALIYLVLRRVHDTELGNVIYRRGVASPGRLPITANNVTIPGGGATLKISKGDIWYTVPHDSFFDCLTAGKPRIPQPHALFFKRMMRRRLILDRHDASMEAITIPISAGNQLNFVELILKPNERIAIDVATLVGFSKTVRFGNIIGLNFAALMQRRIVTPIVIGPGRIVVAARHGGVTLLPSNTVHATSISNVIAWDPDGGFLLHSEHDWWSTYARAPHVIPASDTRMVVQAPSHRQGSTVLRFFRGLLFWLLPF